MEKITFEVTEEAEGMRLDKYLATMLPRLSRTYIQKLIENGDITCNDTVVRSKDSVKLDDRILILLPDPQDLSVAPEDIPLDIVYEDDDVILINKPKGMVVHPAAGHYTGTMVNGLLYHCKDSLSGINGILRPGIVHRIDKDTTGIVVACKNDEAHRNLAEQFKVHSITRAYEALVYGTFSDTKGRIEGNIGRCPSDRLKMAITASGKPAVTNYEVKELFGKKFSHVICRLETGRTHQIRVHMSSIRHPLLGDTVYGAANDPFHLQGQALHAGVLGFVHPKSGEYMEFQAPAPEYFTKLKETLRSREGSVLVVNNSKEKDGEPA